MATPLRLFADGPPDASAEMRDHPPGHHRADVLSQPGAEMALDFLDS
jgi:hypothetical protein